MGFAACLVNLPVKGMSRCFYQGIERVPFFWRRWRLRPAMQLPPRRGGAKSTCTAPLSTPPAPLPPAAAIRRSIWTLFLSDRSFRRPGMTKPFSIELVNCILERPENKPDWKFFQVTFDGYAEGALFGVQGDARGVALEIKDSSGTAVIPGKPLPMEGIIPGNRVLNYSMTLMPNHQPLKVGAYFSTVRFKLDYF